VPVAQTKVRSSTGICTLRLASEEANRVRVGRIREVLRQSRHEGGLLGDAEPKLGNIGDDEDGCRHTCVDIRLKCIGNDLVRRESNSAAVPLTRLMGDTENQVSLRRVEHTGRRARPRTGQGLSGTRNSNGLRVGVSQGSILSGWVLKHLTTSHRLYGGTVRQRRCGARVRPSDARIAHCLGLRDPRSRPNPYGVACTLSF